MPGVDVVSSSEPELEGRDNRADCRELACPSLGERSSGNIQRNNSLRPRGAGHELIYHKLLGPVSAFGAKAQGGLKALRYREIDAQSGPDVPARLPKMALFGQSR